MYNDISSPQCLKIKINIWQIIYFQVLGDEREPHPQQTPELAHHGLRHCEFLPSIDRIITNCDFLCFILQHFKINVKEVKK